MFKKVMVIDDAFVDRYIAQKIIVSLGFAREVIVQESAKEALQALSSLAGEPSLLPELIFLDIKMPEMDGFEFLEAYETLPGIVRQSCRIIMLSSSLDREDLNKANNNKHVNGFISKPLDKMKLENLASTSV